MKSPDSKSAPKQIVSLAPENSLGDVGGNRYFGTLSPAAQARRLAAQARANAANKPVSEYKQLHRTLMKLIHTQPSYAPVRTRQSSAPVKPGARAETDSGAAPQLVRTSLQRALANLRQGGTRTLGAAMLTRLARAISASASGLPSGFYQQIRIARALRRIGTGIGSAASLAAGSRLRPALPSIAPRGATQPSMVPRGAAITQAAGAAAQTRVAASSMSLGPVDGETSPGLALSRRQAGNAANTGQAEAFAVETATKQLELKQALTEYFDQQTRLPPSGATGFDPRLTPAWSGRKLPG